MLSKEETIEKEPLLNESILIGSGYYAEYRTDDARLTIEVLKTAISKGVDCINYVCATDFIETDGKISGIHCKDLSKDEEFKMTAQFVISATGPWVDQLREKNKSLNGSRLHLTKGVHLVVAHEKFPVKQSVYFDVPDGRMIFAIPRGKTTYFGTTDTDYHEKIEDVHTNLEDANYLLEAVNESFPSIHLTLEDVESSWAGLRPLIHQEGKSASELSRKDEIFEAENGLISIAGGKLTGYRKMALRIMDLVMYLKQKQDKSRFKLSKTHKIPLLASDFKDADAVEAFTTEITTQFIGWGLTRLDAEHVVHAYGKFTQDILVQMKDFLPNSPTPLIALIRAELFYSLHNEMVLNPLDFYIRRTGRLYFDIESVKISLESILQDFKAYLHWNDTQYLTEKEKIEKVIHEASHFEAVTVAS